MAEVPASHRPFLGQESLPPEDQLTEQVGKAALPSTNNRQGAQLLSQLPTTPLGLNLDARQRPPLYRHLDSPSLFFFSLHFLCPVAALGCASAYQPGPPTGRQMASKAAHGGVVSQAGPAGPSRKAFDIATLLSPVLSSSNTQPPHAPPSPEIPVPSRTNV